MDIVIISDTHGHHRDIKNLPIGDLIIHSGDFSPYNFNPGKIFKKNSFLDFLIWYSETPYKYKILIAGNHDREVEKMGYKKFFKLCKKYDIIYLENTSIIIDGVKFYGTPYTTLYKNWSFMMNENKLKQIWDKIDEDTDVLITHGPEYGILDKNKFSQHIGSVSLSNRLKELSVKYHLFGHCHEGFGMNEYSNPYISINASCLNKNTYSVNNFIPSISI